MNKPINPPRSSRDKWLTAACFGVAALAVGLVFYYLLFPARGAYSADSYDTLYWAQASYESGQLISRDFYYPTLLPFGGHLLMLPIYHFIGLSMATQVLGMAAFAFLFMAGLWFFCSSLKVSLRQKLLLFSALLMVLSASGKLRELMWEHVIYYSLGILFAALMLGLLFRLSAARGIEDEKRRARMSGLWLGLLLVLTVLVGTDGPQVMVFCTIPVAGALVAERYADGRRPPLDKKNRPAYALAGLMLVAALLGLGLLAVLRGPVRTSYDAEYMSFISADLLGERLLGLPGDWARLLGYDPSAGASLLSFGGILQMLRLAGAVLLVVIPVLAAVGYKQIQSRRERLMLWYHWLQAAILLVVYLISRSGSANWRLTPLVFSGTVVSVLYLYRVLRLPSLRRWAALAAAALVLYTGTSAAAILSMPPDHNAENEITEYVGILDAHGLTYGYADYWVASPITVETGERIRVRNVDIAKMGIDPSQYQSSPEWYQDQPDVDRYFLLLRPEEYVRARQSPDWDRLEQTMVQLVEGDYYTLLIFEENPMKA